MKIYGILHFVIQFPEILIQHSGLPSLLAVASGSVKKYILPIG
jgi:hypothetical protein